MRQPLSKTSNWAHIKALTAAATVLCAPLQSCHPGWTQTQYQYVPESQRANPKTNGQQQAAPNGYMHMFRSGGMQLRSAPMRSTPAPAGTQGRYTQPGATGTRTQQGRSDSAARREQKSYDFVDNFSQDGATRLYRVHIPSTYDRSRATPVVLAFHGLGMNSLAMLAMSGLNGLSDRKGFIVVYGEGINNRWNDGSGGVDDIGYVSTVLYKLSRLANIDSRRVYACGISNGGFFAQRLACNLPDKIAAIAVVASTMMAGAHMAGSYRMPAVFFLGTEDPLLPWDDGRSKALGKLG
ncbi:MAG TPA: PHB depolymerase family esterase, partial [Chroococcales cyanobacterium]